MYTKIIELHRKIDEVFSPFRAIDYMEEIIRFHRIQSTSGLKNATEYVAELLNSFDVSAWPLAIPMNEGMEFEGFPGFQSWEIKEAKLWMVQPERRKLADFDDSVFHIFQRSGLAEGEFELFVAERNMDIDYYLKLDNLADKFILTDKPQYVKDILEVAGIVSEHTREGVEDALLYHSFWWDGTEAKKIPGFVIYKKDANYIRKLQKEGKRIIVKAHVSADFGPGYHYIAECEIKGTGEGEILLIAHLCHPKGEANDNVSGVVSLIEALRSIKHLINKGELDPPLRTIRTLFVPEIYGSVAYLSQRSNLHSAIVGGLNLDMVGQSLDKSGGSFLVEKEPWSAPGFTSSLVNYLKDFVIPHYKGTSPVIQYPSIRYSSTPFSGGSDHIVLNDPYVGIPTSMIIQWPDKFYHSSKDKVENIDPEALKRAGITAALYAYMLATAQEKDVNNIGEIVLLEAKRTLLEEKKNQLINTGTLKFERLKLVYNYYLKAIQSIRKIVDIDVSPLLKRWTSFYRNEISGQIEDTIKERRRSSVVYIRNFKSPVTWWVRKNILSKEERRDALKFHFGLKNSEKFNEIEFIYLVDGRRTIEDIKNFLEVAENHEINPEIYNKYVELTEKTGIIKRKGE